LIHKIENQGKGPYKKVHEGTDLDNGGDNMKLHWCRERCPSNYIRFSNCYHQRI
jgi:hypothetical protein